MFDPFYITNDLERNRYVFDQLLSGIQRQQYLWKPLQEKWCLLEVLCHLYDEEREDFRARLQHVLEQPQHPLPSIDPQGWVTSRQYKEQDSDGMLKKFSAERMHSVEWLKSLTNPAWDDEHQHPKFGAMSGKLFLTNWLAHDYHHIRQITELKHDYLKAQSGESLSYAGDW